MSAFNGGGANVTFFRINDAHTAILQADGTALGGPVAWNDKAYQFKDDGANNIVLDTSKMAFDDAGVGTFTLTTTDSSNAFLSFLEVAAPKSAAVSTVTPQELVSEAGIKIGGASAASGVQYLMIYAGAKTGSLRYTEMAIVTLKKTTGGSDRSSGNWQKQTIEATTVACKNASGFAIAQNCFDTDIYGTIGTAGDRTIAKDAYVKMKNLTAAA